MGDPFLFTQIFYVDSFNIFDFPHKNIIKFFDSIRDLDNRYFENDQNKPLAMGYCILINLKVKSPDLQEFKINNEPINLNIKLLV